MESFTAELGASQRRRITIERELREALGRNELVAVAMGNSDAMGFRALHGTSDFDSVGSGGVMLPNHAPLVIAEQFGTLATLFPGRIDLGLGRAPGSDQRVARALRRKGVEQLRVLLEEMALCGGPRCALVQDAVRHLAFPNVVQQRPYPQGLGHHAGLGEEEPPERPGHHDRVGRARAAGAALIVDNDEKGETAYTPGHSAATLSNNDWLVFTSATTAAPGCACSTVSTRMDRS